MYLRHKDVGRSGKRKGTPSWLAQWCALEVGTPRWTSELMGHPVRVIKKGVCADLLEDTIHQPFYLSTLLI